MKTITVPVKVTISNLDDGDEWTLIGMADHVKMSQADRNGYVVWNSPASLTLDEAVASKKNLNIDFTLIGQTLKWGALPGVQNAVKGAVRSEQNERVIRALS